MSYSIKPDDKAGWDVRTLLPRRIKFSLKLEEIRAGDFTEYESIYVNKKANVIKRDNLSGWEVMITSPGTMDSGEYLSP